MNIGFFGHSTCAGDGPGTYITIVCEHFKATLVNKGCGQASEERILYTLKKCRNLDVAVIFHSRPMSLFLPHCTRDFDIRAAAKDKANVLWRDEPPQEASALEAWHGIYGNFKKVFNTPDEFVNCIGNYKKYLYDPGLHMNRFQGAFVLIDNYCASRIPVTVHIIDEAYVPPWFSGFNSGIRSIAIERLIQEYREENAPCKLSDVGHRQIADILIQLITEQLTNKDA